MSPSLLDFLKHIEHECEIILTECREKSRDEIESKEVLIKAIVRSLEIIREATKKLPEEFRKSYPQIYWKELAGMRDVLIHDYFGIDYDIVWNTITRDIPELEHELKRIIDLEEGNLKKDQ